MGDREENLEIKGVEEVDKASLITESNRLRIVIHIGYQNDYI